MTEILWSGLTGRTGLAALSEVSKVDDAKIVIGLTRHKMNGVININGVDCLGVRWLNYNADCQNLIHHEDFDVMVDFSHQSCFDMVMRMALRTRKPLVIGTSGLTDRQHDLLKVMSDIIPVFYDGNFQFKVKQFMDDAVELAKESEQNLTLYENFYKGKHLPSSTAQVLQAKIQAETGMMIGLRSSATYGKQSLISEWKIGNLTCKTVGFAGLAHDVLEIAKVMATKPVQRGKLYNLEQIWNELPH